MYYKIAQLKLTSKQKSGSIGEIFLAQPDADKEALVGRLFILIEIALSKINPEYSGLKIINFLIDNLNQSYYQNEKIILREKTSSLKVEHIFESALAKTNKNFAKFLDYEKIKIAPDAVNITAGVIYKNNLHLANVGKNKTLLIYSAAKPESLARDNSASAKEKKYKIADIGEKTQASESHAFNAAKLFANVVSGQMPKGGYFILANETLPEYISGKRLIEIAAALPPAGAAEQIKNTLSAINAYVSFLGIIIKNTFGEIESELSYKMTRASSRASIENLNTTEETTEKLLTPSGLISFKKFGGLFDFFAKLKFWERKKQTSAAVSLKDGIFSGKRASLFSIKKIWQAAKNFFAVFANGAYYLIKLASDKEKAASLAGGAKAKISESAKSSLSRFNNLSVKLKIALFALLLCAAVLAYNLISMNLNNKKIEKENIYNDLTESIKRKQSQIEANLLYKNEEGAKKMLDELQTLISELPQDSEQQKQFYVQIIEKFNQQSENIRHVVNAAPNELANFANLNSDAEPDNIILLNGMIYSGDTKQKSIYSLDLTNNTATAITGMDKPISLLSSPTADKDGNIYYFNSNGAIKFDSKSEKITQLPMDSKNGQGIIGMECYGGKIYLLDRQNSQIFRYNIAGNGLNGAQNWLKEKADFAAAVDLAIDGSVYVLENNGILLKYLKGNKQEFKLDEIEPKLEKPARLFVSPELNFIYILEPAGKRLAVYDKSGKYLMQYQSDSFNALKDFAVDEKNKKIYLLNKTSAYSIEAKHFELK